MRNWMLAIGASALVTFSAGAAESAVASDLVQGANGAVITSSDILADSKRLPPQMHDTFLAKKENVQQMVEALYVRRAIALEAKKAGLMDDPEVRAQMQIANDQFLSDAYLQKFNEKHKPNAKLLDAQMKAHYAANKDSYVLAPEVHAAHILVKGNDDAAKQKAEKLLAQLKAGADFAEMAKTQSDDPGSAAKGGDLGVVAKGRMVPEFEKAVFALQSDNALSDIVPSRFGFHIIKALSVKPGKQQTYEEVKPEMEKQFTAKALAAARKEVVDKILEEARFNDANIEALSSKYSTAK